MKDAIETRVLDDGDDAERKAFREKLRYWRENGAPGYIGPRAVRDRS